MSKPAAHEVLIEAAIEALRKSRGNSLLSDDDRCKFQFELSNWDRDESCDPTAKITLGARRRGLSKIAAGLDQAIAGLDEIRGTASFFFIVGVPKTFGELVQGTALELLREMRAVAESELQSVAAEIELGASRQGGWTLLDSFVFSALSWWTQFGGVIESQDTRTAGRKPVADYLVAVANLRFGQNLEWDGPLANAFAKVALHFAGAGHASLRH